MEIIQIFRKYRYRLWWILFLLFTKKKPCSLRKRFHSNLPPKWIYWKFFNPAKRFSQLERPDSIMTDIFSIALHFKAWVWINSRLKENICPTFNICDLLIDQLIHASVIDVWLRLAMTFSICKTSLWASCLHMSPFYCFFVWYRVCLILTCQDVINDSIHCPGLDSHHY